MLLKMWFKYKKDFPVYGKDAVNDLTCLKWFVKFHNAPPLCKLVEVDSN